MAPEGMSFPITPPVEPMLSKAAATLPDTEGVCYEPKWDGFRAIVFRGASELYIQSRELKPLDRYFPELHDALLAVLPPGCVVDGEIVIASPDGLDFDALQMRLHPAASRVKKLALEMPASFVAFDLLAANDEDLRGRPLSERRARLERHLRGHDEQPGTREVPPHADDDRPCDGRGLARAIRGGWPRRRDGQACRRTLRAGQARDDQGEASADRRLRGRRLPLAQEWPRHARRLAAAGAVRRAAARCSTWA